MANIHYVGARNVITAAAVKGKLTDKDVDKPVKLVGNGLVELAQPGDEVFGFVTSVEEQNLPKNVVGVSRDTRHVTVTGSEDFTGPKIVVLTDNPADGVNGAGVVFAEAAAPEPEGPEVGESIFKWVAVDHNTIMPL